MWVVEGGRRKNIIINTNIKLLEWECDSQGWMLFVCDAVSLSVSQSAGELGTRERERAVSRAESVSWATLGHCGHQHSITNTGTPESSGCLNTHLQPTDLEVRSSSSFISNSRSVRCSLSHCETSNLDDGQRREVK